MVLHSPLLRGVPSDLLSELLGTLGRLAELPKGERAELLRAIARSRDPDSLLSAAEVEELTGRKARTLEEDRRRGIGIPYVRIGPRAVKYRWRDVLAYIEARTVRRAA